METASGANQAAYNPASLVLPEAINPEYRRDGLTPYRLIREGKQRTLSGARDHLYRRWVIGELERERQRHPDYNGRLGYVYWPPDNP